MTRRWLSHRAAQFVWSHPEWWALTLSAIAWVTLAAAEPHDHHRAFGSQLTAWLIMSAAMMVPLASTTLRQVAFRSLWRRRHRAIGAFLLGYLAVWLVVGVIVIAAVQAVPVGSVWPATIGAVVVAIIWRSTPAYRRALRGCHRIVPLAPHDPLASLDDIWFGWLIGRQCVTTCWALMIICALTGHNLAAMAAATAVAARDRYV